jgi:UDP-N-acetylglucosamine--N-acetylmuramyl-(pentapeptide) pyrophosphoryl-undecaprenol N-acetylglucosamine transferase
MRKIILSGGGTLGPVVPLLAVAEMYKAEAPDTVFVWVGTSRGPERSLVEEAHIPFIALSAGKWRRYFSLLNITDTFKILVAFFHSLIILTKEKPSAVVSCGGFVSVPLHLAAAVLGIPAWVHQQDVRLGLANKIMFPFAKKITTAIRDTVGGLPEKKTEWIGNPVRDLSVLDVRESRKKFGIPEGAPVVLALGGGTGSTSINMSVAEALPHLPNNWHVIHLVGKDRPKESAEKAAQVFKNYHVFPFLTDQMKDAYAVADVVLARAGFATLSELAMLKKAAIIMPMYGTHQEDNAREFADKEAIYLLPKGEGIGIVLANMLKELMADPAKRAKLGEALHRELPNTESKTIAKIMNELFRA